MPLQKKSILNKVKKAAVLSEMTLVFIHNASHSHTKSYHSMNALKYQYTLNTNFDSDSSQNATDQIGQAFTSISVSDIKVCTFS